MRTKIIVAGLCLCIYFINGQMLLAATNKQSSAGIGPISYQIPHHLSPNEKKWYKVFQEGNMAAPGWVSITTEILSRTPPTQRQQQQHALSALGRRIGEEWAKDNQVRKVNTSMLRQWGNLLKTTARQKPEQLPQAIARIDRELDTALAQ